MAAYNISFTDRFWKGYKPLADKEKKQIAKTLALLAENHAPVAQNQARKRNGRLFRMQREYGYPYHMVL